MHCCEIVPSLEERHGGPSRSVAAIARALAETGEDVTLLATHPSELSAHEDGRYRQQVFRRDWPQALCPSAGMKSYLKNHDADVIHHHSIWLRTLGYARQAARRHEAPLVISPRGMMSTWAWKHRHWRKQIARAILHPGAFRDAAGWHATSPEEADEIKALGFTQPVCVAPNGVAAPDADDVATARAYWQQACPDVTQRPTALFYSRLHQKKRVLELIDAWLARAPSDWMLLIVGVPESYTPSQLETYVLRASGVGRVRVFDGENRPPPYAVASLFLLPSHNENFGLVIAEAMAHGLPALVTDTTPWSELDAAGAGWCVPWERYEEALQSALAEGLDRLNERGAVARAHVLARYSWANSAEILRQFYQQLIDSPRRG